MLISDRKSILKKFHRNAPGKSWVWTAAFSPSALRHAAELITNPTYSAAMKELDGIDLTYSAPYRKFHKPRIKADMAVLLHDQPIMLSKVIPGDDGNEDKSALIADMVRAITLVTPSVAREAHPMRLRLWTYRGLTKFHMHEFSTGNLIIAGPGTLVREKKMPTNSVGLVSRETLHASPTMPQGQIRFAGIVYSA